MVSDQYLTQTWEDVQTRLRNAFPDSVYDIWLAPLQPLELRDSVLYVEAPSETREWVSRRFGTTIVQAAAAADTSIRRVELLDSKDRTEGTRGLQRPTERDRWEAPLRSASTFERFVIGPTNRFGHAAALTVAELPGQAYDPLFVHGPTGVGKTHLLQAIANYLRLYDPRIVVRYTTAEAFTSHFMAALQRGELEAFKHAFRGSDVLLFDDIQFLGGKQRTAEELFHTLEAVSGGNTQAVLTGDRHPGELEGLDQGLLDRLQAGLIVDLQPPDPTTRRVILRKLAACSDSNVGEDVIDYLALRLPANARILEGTFIRLLAFASMTGGEPTLEAAERVLASMPETAQPPFAGAAVSVSVAQIIHHTGAALALDPDELRSARRRRRVVYARQVAMYLAREMTDLSLPAIARHFGGRDHTTVLHAHRKISREVLADESCRSLVGHLRKTLERTPQAAQTKS